MTREQEDLLTEALASEMFAEWLRLIGREPIPKHMRLTPDVARDVARSILNHMADPFDENRALLRRLDAWTPDKNAGPLIRWAAAHIRGCIEDKS